MSNLSCKVYPDNADVNESYVSNFNNKSNWGNQEINPRSIDPYVNALILRDKNDLKKEIYEEVINVLLLLNVEEAKQIALTNKNQPKKPQGRFRTASDFQEEPSAGTSTK